MIALIAALSVNALLLTAACVGINLANKKLLAADALRRESRTNFESARQHYLASAALQQEASAAREESIRALGQAVLTQVKTGRVR